MLKYQTLTQALDDRSRGTGTITYLEGENTEKTLKLADLRRRALGILRHLQGQAGVRSLRTCVLAEKALAAPAPAVQRLREALRLDYVGFRVPDRWLAGYGIDAGEELRNLPCIVTVNEEHFRS